MMNILKYFVVAPTVGFLLGAVTWSLVSMVDISYVKANTFVFFVAAGVVLVETFAIIDR